MDYGALPGLNAVLNASSAGLLVIGQAFIRRQKIKAHRICMVGAFAVSCLFLISYLIYHAHAGSVPYQGRGIARVVYFAILISHSILAALIVPMILRTLYLAVKERFQEHRRWARWTYPAWLYVSITGVVIYEMLY